MDQRSLVERAQHGDHDAFAELARMHVARLDAAARLILRDHDLARDAVQEGFIRAWRSLPTLREPDAFDGWLRTLVTRACLDVVRRRGRRPIEVELTPVDEPTMPDSAISVADRELLDLTLRRLPPDARAVVVLHYYFDLSLPEVAATIGVPLGTAKSRLNRALTQMRTHLADLDREPAPLAGGQVA
jgi:RNA polymerase sigma-70 factor (ECF subfamily)